MDTSPVPIIHCTPPGDPAYLASVARAFDEARGLLSSDLEVLVGVTVRIRTLYPDASIIAVPLLSSEGPARFVWLVSRDGWAEIAPSRRADGAGTPIREREGTPPL
jgi:hypothetical protein